MKVKNDNIDYAVRQAIDLLGGIKTVSSGKERIMLKPNLVSPEPRDATKIDVVKALAQLMTEAGKDVSIGEGSAAATEDEPRVAAATAPSPALTKSRRSRRSFMGGS